MGLKWPDKDPQADKDYGIDWTDMLADGETITTAAWAVSPAGPTLSDESILDGVCTVWIAGGTVDTAYALTCTITTSRGMIDERTVTIKVKQL
jgi:hypothetical protein